MGTLTTDQQKKITDYIAANWGAPSGPTPTETDHTISLIHDSKSVTIEASDLLEGLDVKLQTPPSDPEYAIVYELAAGGLWRCEIPITFGQGTSVTVNPPSGTITVSYKSGPSAVFVATQTTLVKAAISHQPAGTPSSIFALDKLKHNYIEAQAPNKEEAINLGKAALAWLGQQCNGQKLELVLYKDELNKIGPPIQTELPQIVGIDCRTPLDYFLYGTSARRRATAYLAFYHVIEFYMGEIEIQQLQEGFRYAYSRQHRFGSREFAIAFMQAYPKFGRNLNEADMLHGCLKKIPDSGIEKIITNRRGDLTHYTINSATPPLLEVIGSDKKFKNATTWNYENIRKELANRIYKFRNALLHAKSSEEANITLRTLESDDWPLFDIGLARDVAYYLLCSNFNS